MTVNLDWLRKIPYFEGLSSKELEYIGKNINERYFERGSMIIMDGTQASALYFIISGVVKIFKISLDGKEQIFRILRPGDSFNEVPVFDNGVTPVSAEAMTPVTLYEIDKDVLNNLIDRYPLVAKNIIKIMAERVRHLVSLVEDLSFKTVVGRVAKILYETASNGKNSGHKLTQQQMAAIAGTAREVVGRSLKSMEDEGIISVDRNRIIIKNKEALKKLATS